MIWNTVDMPDFPVTDLVDWLLACSRVAVITGAGVSTASGIPDYRDVDGQWKRTQPVTFQQFVGDVNVCQHYW